jgi:hypothetical protein
MTNPTDKIKGVLLALITEGTQSASNAGVTTIDTAGVEKIQLTNKGPNTVYFRTDGTDPTSGVAGNADQLVSGAKVEIQGGRVASVKLICAAAETATVFYRLFS